MIAEHFWKVIFIAIFAVGCWFWWKDASAKKLHRQQIAYLAELIDVADGNEPKSDGETTERFFRALAAIEAIEFRQGEKFQLDATIEAANALNDSPSGVKDLLERALVAAYRTAREDLKLFDDDDAISRLEEGARPKITAGPWAGQWAEAGYYIPPSVEESVANRICNRTLVPESVKGINANGAVTSTMNDWADRMKRAKILDIVAHKRISTEYDLLRKQSTR